jgi:hypothetical protein
MHEVGVVVVSDEDRTDLLSVGFVLALEVDRPATGARGEVVRLIRLRDALGTRAMSPQRERVADEEVADGTYDDAEGEPRLVLLRSCTLGPGLP